jgi:hypothetical protein
LSILFEGKINAKFHILLEFFLMRFVMGKEAFWGGNLGWEVSLIGLD